MDININAEVKVVGVATAPAVEREDQAKPQVARAVIGAWGHGPRVRGPGKVKLENTIVQLGLDAWPDVVHSEKKEERSKVALEPEELEKAVSEIQDRLDVMGTRLDVSVNKEPNAFVVKITDRESGATVKQFPSEEVLALKKKLQELTGLMFDKTM